MAINTVASVPWIVFEFEKAQDPPKVDHHVS